MNGLSLEDIEIIKILASSDFSLIQAGMTPEIRKNLNNRIGNILRKYYRENTLGLEPIMTKKFEKLGISKDDGKSAISCARRLGINIS